MALSFDIAAEITKHEVKMMNLKKHNSSTNVGWHPKRAICIKKGCKNKRSNTVRFVIQNIEIIIGCVLNMQSNTNIRFLTN